MIYGYVADLFSVSFGNFGNFGIFGYLPHFHPKTPKTLKTISGFRFSVIGFRRRPARPIKVPYDPRYECISYVNRRSLCRPTCPTRHFVLLSVACLCVSVSAYHAGTDGRSSAPAISATDNRKPITDNSRKSAGDRRRRCRELRRRLRAVSPYAKFLNLSTLSSSAKPQSANSPAPMVPVWPVAASKVKL